MNRGEEPQSQKARDELFTNKSAVNARGDHIELPVDELVFRHLRTHRDIEEILHLREELNLPERVRNDTEFHRLEKKETKKAWWVHSSGKAD